MVRPLALLLLLAAPAPASDVAAAYTPAAPGDQAAPETQVWIGVISVLGSRKIPLLGKIDFQTDTFVLAQATRRSDLQWDVRQTTCRVAFPKTMGAEITVDPTAFGKIPKADFSWVIGQDGTWSAGPWRSGWDESDHDGDGEAGLTLQVEAPFCGGDLFASSEATQTATGRPTSTDLIAGDIRVHVIQKTLGTRGPCLGLMARDSDEWMDGRFRMVRAPAGTTCDSDLEWPRVTW